MGNSESNYGEHWFDLRTDFTYNINTPEFPFYPVRIRGRRFTRAFDSLLVE